MSNEKKNDGGPAFPCRVILEDKLGGAHESTNPGMSLRDHFAGLAMQGFVAKSGGSGPQHLPDIGNEAYMFADIMLRAREQ